MSTIRSLFQLARAGIVMVREGVVASLPGEDLTGLPKLGWRMSQLFSRRNAGKRKDRLARAIARLGPSYVKLGQFLATRPDVVGADIADDLSGLLDKMDKFPKEQALKQIEGSLGRPCEQLYQNIDDPVAAASIAQVHPAHVKDTDGAISKVAVKVIRPGVRERFRRDNEAFLLSAQLQEKFIPASRRLKPTEIAKTLEMTTRIEMDLRLEAAALSEMADNTKDDPHFRVPQVDWDRTGRDVITMEWIDGIKLTDKEALLASGFDLKALSEVVIQSFLRHALRDGFFHADMHPGNLFLANNGDLVAVDLGISGRLGKKERRFLAEILLGFINRDYMRVAEVHFEAGYVPAHHDVASFAQAIRAIGEPIHGQPAETISMAKLLTLLFEVTALFDMETRPELILLQKTMVAAEGVARSLDPGFNMWVTAKPVIEKWILDNLGPKAIARDVGEGLKAGLVLAQRLPELVQRTEALAHDIETMGTNGLRFDAETAVAIGKAEARYTRSGRVALWVIAISLGAIAVSLI